MNLSTDKVVRSYLELFFGGAVDLKKIHSMLHDNFTFNGPLMSANSADDFINQLSAMGDFNLQAEIHQILCDGDQVVALYDFVTPAGKVPAAEWYLIEKDVIKSMRLFCDPRPFLEAFGG